MGAKEGSGLNDCVGVNDWQAGEADKREEARALT